VIPGGDTRSAVYHGSYAPRIARGECGFIADADPARKLRASRRNILGTVRAPVDLRERLG
jgi:hypothetical protein